jgi:hypothetical protein
VNVLYLCLLTAPMGQFVVAPFSFAGQRHGVVLYFDSKLSGSVDLSNAWYIFYITLIRIVSLVFILRLNQNQLPMKPVQRGQRVCKLRVPCFVFSS